MSRVNYKRANSNEVWKNARITKLIQISVAYREYKRYKEFIMSLVNVKLNLRFVMQYILQ